MIHIIKVDIIYLIWYLNYMEFNLALIVNIKLFLLMLHKNFKEFN